MDNMDNFRERFEALERRTQMVEQRLRWWRGIACGVVMLSLLSLALPSSKAADGPAGGMAERMATLEQKLAAMEFDPAANEVVISGANLRIVNGLGITETTNGVGNLIVGYNELRSSLFGCQSGPTDPFCTDTRTGSHNVVVGRENNFSRFGGIVGGRRNEISGDFSSVSGGLLNTASGNSSSVSGGFLNTASGVYASVSGGQGNTASGDLTSVSGGADNTASVDLASVSGGQGNTASRQLATVSGGQGNTASGQFATVSGGQGNTASGQFATVSGGQNRTAEGQFNWVAGPLFADE